MSIKHSLYRLKFHAAPVMNWRAPVHIDIETAGKCQLRCLHCNFGIDGPKRFGEDLQGMMKKPMAMKALREAREMGALSCKLNFRGEPGLCKWLHEAVAYAKELGYTEVMINTNLTAFTPHRLRLLVAAGIDKIIVSIDGASKETYEAIRVKGDYPLLLASMRWLWNFVADTDTKVIVQFVEQPLNAEERDWMPMVWGPYCHEIRYQKVQDRGQGAATNPNERKQCPQPWQRLIVAWDGTIFGCCSNWHNEFPLGNYREMSLRKAWSGERMAELRRIAKHPASGAPCDKCQVAVSYRKR